MRYFHEEIRPASLRGVGVDVHAAFIASYAFGASLLVAVGVLLLIRRLSGAFVADFPAPISTSLFLIGLVILSAWASRFFDSERKAACARLLALVSVLCVSAALVSIPLRSTDMAFIAVAIVGTASVLPTRVPKKRANGKEDPLDIESVLERRLSELARINPKIEQVSIRTSERGGTATVFATLVAHIGTGEQSNSLHIAFCPPLPETPIVSAEITEGDAQVQIGQSLAVGARIDIQLNRPAAERQRIAVNVFAISKQRIRSK